MEATVLRSEAWKIIDSGEPFDLEFVTADLRRKTGGKYIRVHLWVKKPGRMAVEILPGEKPHRARIGKDPRHHTNKTCVIYNPRNSEAHPVTIHYRLIQYLNGKRIING
jgi:hypothetical protein